MKKFRELYYIDQLPVFQNRMYDTAIEAINCPKGDIHLVEDIETGLIYNSAFCPELLVYDENYQNEQAVSPFFQEHLESVAKIIAHTIGRDGLVEVGCGKGYFLELLLKHGFDITGFDPAYEGTNILIERHYFEPSLGIKANGLILRHVLEHIQDPLDFLFRLKETNRSSGLIYIEVPNFDWICARNAWFDIFYEHANYFRLTDFKHMFGKIVDCGTLFNEQYIYVVADLASLKVPKYADQERVRFPQNFLHRLMEKDNRNSSIRTIWGGASKGVIFSLLKQRMEERINTVIDINPAKQGKYLPATGLKVQSFSEALPILTPGSTIWIMNSNYLEEIKSMSGNNFNYLCIDHE